MSARMKLLAAAVLTAVGMATTVGTVVVAQSAPQRPRGADESRAREGRDSQTPQGQTTPLPGMPGMRGGIAGPMTPGWEYKVVDIPLDGGGTRLEERLNKLGAEGWELSLKGERDTVVFKRPKFPGGVAAGGGMGFGGMMMGGPAAEAAPAGGGGSRGGRGSGAGSTAPAGGGTGLTTGTTGGGLGGFGTFGAVPAKPGEVQVIQLKNATAPELAALLKEVFARTAGLAVTADARTNSLIVSADDAMLKTVKSLVERLDEPVPDPAPPRKR